uniref:Uncharacterized protein n=1 Tax=Pelusios castaneus TaxID=367368 RepID=A0A8C8SK78_9SAUR
MFYRQSWTLALCTSITLSFTLSVLWKRQSPKSQTKAAPVASNGVRPDPIFPCWSMAQKSSHMPIAPVLDAEQCWELGQNLKTGPVPERLVKRWILRQLKLMQNCSWTHNASALDQYRAQLGLCCNASARLLLTQENTPLGSELVYDGQPTKKLKVQEDLWKILPQGSPFQGPLYEYCAVVGNGGILRNSSCGPEIDRAQFVIRFNLPPMGFLEDVGTKSSIITLNPSVLQSRFSGLNHHRRPFAEAVGAYGASLLLIPAFSFPGHKERAFQVLYTLEDFGSPARTRFMNPDYLGALDGHWRRHGFRTRRLSSGFMLTRWCVAGSPDAWVPSWPLSWLEPLFQGCPPAPSPACVPRGAVPPTGTSTGIP